MGSAPGATRAWRCGCGLRNVSAAWRCAACDALAPHAPVFRYVVESCMRSVWNSQLWDKGRINGEPDLHKQLGSRGLELLRAIWPHLKARFSTASASIYVIINKNDRQGVTRVLYCTIHIIRTLLKIIVRNVWISQLGDKAPSTFLIFVALLALTLCSRVPNSPYEIIRDESYIIHK